MTVATPGGTSPAVNSDLYAYGKPTISSFTPQSGITGSTVTINGTNFVPSVTAKFATKSSPLVTFVSPTQVKARVPDGAAAGRVSVTSSAGTGASTTNFTPTLSVTSFTPTTGHTGTVVTIIGVGFNGSSSVKFDGTTASPVTMSRAPRSRRRCPRPPRGTDHGHQYDRTGRNRLQRNQLHQDLACGVAR